MKQFEQNPLSENAKKEMDVMQGTAEERGSIITPSKHLIEVTSEQEKYSPEYIKNNYRNHISQIRFCLSSIEKYLEAKQKLPAQAHLVEKLTTSRPGTVLIDEMALLNEYEKRITFFEQNGAPEEVLKNAKEVLKELKEDIKQLADVARVAHDSPSLN